MGPLPSEKRKCNIHNSLDAKITAVLFTMANVALISIFYGSITLRLAKVIGVLPVLAVYVAAYCMFAQGKIIRFSIAPGDLQSKGPVAKKTHKATVFFCYLVHSEVPLKKNDA